VKIIIVGSGKVGFTLAENLTNENHDVTIIDTQDAPLQKASEMLDVLTIKGNGASISILKNAGVERADALIAVTGRDELNMVCCFTAKKLGANYTVARIRDYEYAIEINQLKSELEIDLAINPEYATATQISRLLRFPNALDIETFYRGRIELVGFRATEEDIITGKPLSVVRKHIGNLPILFCAVERDGNTFIPNGSSVLEPDDRVYVIGDVVNISKFFKVLGRITQRIKDTFIIGGGRITTYLSRLLSDTNVNVKIIEQNPDKCINLCEMLPKALVVNGDGTDQELLDSESLEKAASFVALTGRDEDNLITALYAKQKGVQKVIAKINRQNYYTIVDDIGLDCVISPKTITAYAILQKIRAMQNSHGSRMEALYPIANGGAEALEFTVVENTKYKGIPLKQLKLKKGVLLAVIARNGRMIIPEGNDSINIGDNIIIVTSLNSILDINDIYDE